MAPTTTCERLRRVLAEVCPGRRIDLAGAVALPCPLPHAERWRTFLAEERHGDLPYLQRDPDGRLDPTRRHRWARSVLVFAQRYTDGWPTADTDPAAGGPRGGPDAPPWTARVARYARGRDYHDVLLADIESVMAAMQRVWTDLEFRASTDTGPYLEREYAWLAGLGFLGKNTCLIHEKLGSGLFLGVALTNLDVGDLPREGAAPEPLFAAAVRRRRSGDDAPTSRCGRCTRCIEACPTTAILAGGGLDAGRCLSTWTIEWRGQVPPGSDGKQGGILFGCDICQAVCPWNNRAADAAAAGPVREEYAVREDHAELHLADLVNLSDETFRDRFRRTPLWRMHPEGLRRNARRVLDNLADDASGGGDE